MRGYIALLAVALIAACSATDGESIVGTWRGSYDGLEVVMTFEAEGQITVLVGDDLGVGTYHVDHTREPAHLDIQFEDIGEVLTLVRFLDENSLQVQNMAPGGRRPEEFSDSAPVLVREEVNH
jgi:outer membrane biogenesis lipoprotein LolB